MQLVYGLIGVITGAVITYTVQRFESRRMGRISRTHRLYESWQSPDNFPFRTRADEILKKNAKASAPKSFMELKSQLNSGHTVSDWTAITRTVHFFEECGALLDTRAVDLALFRSLFDQYVIYWVDRCLRPLYEASLGKDEEIELNWYRRVESLRSAMNT
jgi:hypothetical protein